MSGRSTARHESHGDEPTAVPGAPRRGRGRRLAIVVAALVSAALGVAGLVMVLRPPSGPVDMNGRAVVYDPGSEPSSEELLEMDVVEEIGARFKVPSVGLNVPVGVMSMVGDEIKPPGFTSAYLVRNLGVPLEDASNGTVYLAVHSLRGGAIGPGNYLIDINQRRARLQPGELLSVDDVEYRVTGSTRVGKESLGAERSVWANEPGRLVVVTCLQRPQGGPSVDNIVITAELVT